jgi:hypothetical protein
LELGIDCLIFLLYKSWNYSSKKLMLPALIT